MVIAASVILLLAILLAPILLIQFRKRWVAAFKAMIMNMFVHTAHHRAQIEW